MIASLTGTLTSKSPTEITVDVHGVGYAVLIPLSTFQTLGPVASTVSLFTHLHVREDAMQLFGFATTEERELFRLLISVTGIGPKIAQAMLSGMSAEELRQHIAAGRTTPLTAIPNVGRKTAERIVLELREKVAKATGEHPFAGEPVATSTAVRSETLSALTSLGYGRPAAEKAIRAALHDAGTNALTVEELIKLALRHVTDR